jgi:hypothetical protein
LLTFTRTKQPHEANRALEGGFDHGAFFPEKFETTEEGRTPRAGSQQASKKDYRVDADAALARPVGLRVQVEPEGEFVQRERRSRPVADGHQTTEEDGYRRVFAPKVEKPSIADKEQDKDSPDEVVDVPSANHDPVKRADVVRDEADQDANTEEGDEKREGGDEKASARSIGDRGAYEKAEVREMKKKKKGGDNKGGKEEKNQRAGSDIHGSIETLWAERIDKKEELCRGVFCQEREREHDFAVQQRVKLDKASTPAVILEHTQTLSSK